MRLTDGITRLLLVSSFIVVLSIFHLIRNLPSISVDKSGRYDFGREGSSGLMKNGHYVDLTQLKVIEEGTEEVVHEEERSQIPVITRLQNESINREINEELKEGLKEKIWEMEDQLIMAKAYLHFAPPNTGNSHMVKELKLRIKEIQRVWTHTTSTSHLSRSGLQKMGLMEETLFKAQRAYPDCSAMASKLRAITLNTEEQLKAEQMQASYLTRVATRTFPKGLHCLSMRLTSEYFELERKSNRFGLERESRDFDLYHFAVFSDNVLACAVVVNSTISNSKNPEKIAFHIITDSLNFPAISAWFLLHPPSPSKIQIQVYETLQFLPSNFSTISEFHGIEIHDPRYTSPLNYLRFYLPQIFPSLSKILLLDHDVVVMKDLSDLWRLDMEGKVNLAVEKCNNDDIDDDVMVNKLSSLLNFTEIIVENSFDRDTCVWAYGVNLFDLDAWRRFNLTDTFHKWLKVGKGGKIWRAGTLPIAQMVFYNHTIALDRRWHLFGLGKSNHQFDVEKMERFGVLHYEGNAKPWLEISNPEYKVYWSKFLNYDDHVLLQCNIHE